jgi:hypothetical protein
MRIGIAATMLAAAGLAGCGGGDEGAGGTIPPEHSQSLLAQLEDIRVAIDDDNCTSARTDATQFVEEVNALPEESGVELKEQLREAGQNLDDLVTEECEDTGATGETGPVEETTTTAPPVTPPPVEETPPVDEETDEEPSEQPPGQGGEPPGQGGDDSGGVGEEKRKGKGDDKHGGKDKQR